MPKASEELTRARRDEIISACAALYEAVGFKDVTLKEIGQRTSFTRTSIYNYFQTKEEIFLALLQREYEEWIADLETVMKSRRTMSADDFAAALAHTLERRGCMLKLTSMNLYDIECRSRVENLVAFKRAYAAALEALGRCLNRFFPAMTADDVREFLYAFFPFLFGVYPYTSVTEKQREAMERAGLGNPGYSVYTLVRPLVEKLLRPYERRDPREGTPDPAQSGTET